MGEGDKREGAEDLFEDLDKFFAPIKDVDWPQPDEPAEPTAGPDQPDRPDQVESGRAAAGPQEAEPEPESEPAISGKRPDAASGTGEGAAESEPAEGEGERELAQAVWYDTQEMEPLAAAGEDEDDVPIVIDEEEEAEIAGQTGLFAGEQPEEGDDSEPMFVSDAVTDQFAEQPSEEDVQAAADYFAESMRSEEPAGEEAEAVQFAAGEEERDETSKMGAAEIEEDILADLEGRAEPHTVKVAAEGLGGPSWQDPTSMEVGVDLDRRGERDVPAAFVTGVVLAALAVGSLLIGKAAFAVVAGIIVLVAQGELFGVMHAHHKQPATAVGLVTGALVLWGAYEKGEGAALAMSALGVMAAFLWFMAVPGIHRKETLVNVSLTVFNVIYIPVLGSFLLLTVNLGADGKDFVLSVIALTFVFDAVAFLAGATFGGSSIQRPLAADTSPKKSWEGILVATLVTVIISVGFVGSFVKPFENHQLESFLLAIVISLAATFGDLAESLIKRDLGIKDMGNVLPGHGGVLDRVDSLLFAAPAAYLLFRVLFS